MAKVSNGESAGEVQAKEQEIKKERSEIALDQPKNKTSGEENKDAMPEWKLKCLCTEYTIPLSMRGTLGCF